MSRVKMTRSNIGKALVKGQQEYGVQGQKWGLRKTVRKASTLAQRQKARRLGPGMGMHALYRKPTSKGVRKVPAYY